MQGFGLQNAALGIRNSSNEWNPSSADKDLYLAGIRNPRLGILDCLVSPYMGRKGSKRITRCILNIFLPESSVSASSVSTAVSVASSESSSVKSVLSLSISSFDSRSLSSSKEKKKQVYLGRSPYPPPESCSSHWYFKKAEQETRPSCLSQRHLGSLLLGRAGQLLANCPPSIFFNIKRRLKVQNC